MDLFSLLGAAVELLVGFPFSLRTAGRAAAEKRVEDVRQSQPDPRPPTTLVLRPDEVAATAAGRPIFASDRGGAN